MRLVLQRVLSGSATVDGLTVGSIGPGLVVLVGISRDDRKSDLEYLVRKMLNLRLWADERGTTWNQSVMQKKLDVLLVSQFTLYGMPKGNKPDFHLAMGPEPAEEVFNEFVKRTQQEYKGGKIQTGKFGADMKVALVNDGPVTITLETDSMDFSVENAKEDKLKAKWQKQSKEKESGVPNGEATPSASPEVPAPSPSVESARSPAPTSSPTPVTSRSPAAEPKTNKSKSSKNQSNAAGSASTSSATGSNVSVASSPIAPLASPSFASLVGNTSLIHLRHISEATGCAIYGKAEYENPGGSIKDRPALAIIQAAEAAGDLVHGQKGWIVEGTAGNTGIGLTLAGAARGYKTIIVMADNNSQEKKDALRAIGATLLEVPMVPYSNPNNYVHVAKRVYESMKAQFEKDQPETKVILADQWSNAANRQAHFRTTGPEILRQTAGNVDAFCCGVGTGGTLSGVSLFLKSRRPDVKSVLIDPDGSSLKSFFETGELKSTGSSIAEGIGQGRLCDNLIRDGFKPDECIRVTDQEALTIAYDLLEKEGLSIGSSSAVNVCGAYKLAKQLGPGHTIVTVLADAGTRYASKMANPTFLQSKNLPIPNWLDSANLERQELQLTAHEWLKQALVSVPETNGTPAAASSSPVRADRTIRPIVPSDLPYLRDIIAQTNLFSPDYLNELIAPHLAGVGEEEIWRTMDGCITPGSAPVPIAVTFAGKERYTFGCWNLHLIAVHPSQQGKGVGKQLIQYFETELKEQKNARLLLIETSDLESFATPRAFYDSLGYSSEGVIRDFYTEGEDKLIFYKKLNPNGECQPGFVNPKLKQQK